MSAPKWTLKFRDEPKLRQLEVLHLGNRILIAPDPSPYCFNATEEMVMLANRGAVTTEAARSVTLSEYDGKSDCYYAWRQLQDAGAWVWDTEEMPENDPQRFEIMHAIQQAMGLLARRFTDKDLSLATEAKGDA